MSQEQRKDMGVFPDGPKKDRLKGPVTKPSAGTFKSNKIASNLPSRQPLDSGGIKAPGFQDLRESKVRKGSI